MTYKSRITDMLDLRKVGPWFAWQYKLFICKWTLNALEIKFSLRSKFCGVICDSVSSGRLTWHEWRRDGNTLYFVALNRDLLAVTVSRSRFASLHSSMPRTGQNYSHRIHQAAIFNLFIPSLCFNRDQILGCVNLIETEESVVTAINLI